MHRIALRAMLIERPLIRLSRLQKGPVPNLWNSIFQRRIVVRATPRDYTVVALLDNIAVGYTALCRLSDTARHNDCGC